MSDILQECQKSELGIPMSRKIYHIRHHRRLRKLYKPDLIDSLVYRCRQTSPDKL